MCYFILTRMTTTHSNTGLERRGNKRSLHTLLEEVKVQPQCGTQSVRFPTAYIQNYHVTQQV